jgi:N-acetyl-alpha-D-muramate 1-phosphate uridylyltransferase
LVPVAGRPFIEYTLERLREYGARRVVLCIGYLGEVIVDALADGRRFGLDITYVWDPPGLAGTAGAVRGALKALGDEFLVMYGDTFLRVDYGEVAAAHRRSGMAATMTVLKNDSRWEPSNVTYTDGRVTGYDKLNPPAGARWIDYGLLCMSAGAVSETDESDLSEIQRSLAASGEMAGVVVTRRFIEIGTPASLASADALFARYSARHAVRERARERP